MRNKKKKKNLSTKIDSGTSPCIDLFWKTCVFPQMSSSDSEDGSGDVPLMQLLMLQRQLNLKRDKYMTAMKTTNGAVLSSGPVCKLFLPAKLSYDLTTLS